MDVGRPDNEVRGFGDRDVLLIVQGRHGYISPSWTSPKRSQCRPGTSTWPLLLIPKTLELSELGVLTTLVKHFEQFVEQPVLLEPAYGAGLAATRAHEHPKLAEDMEPALFDRAP